MIFELEFEELEQRFELEFGEINNVSDDSYERGYADAREKFEPKGTVVLTENGEHDVADYVEAVVNVFIPEYRDGDEEAY